MRLRQIFRLGRTFRLRPNFRLRRNIRLLRRMFRLRPFFRLRRIICLKRKFRVRQIFCLRRIVRWPIGDYYTWLIWPVTNQSAGKLPRDYSEKNPRWRRFFSANQEPNEEFEMAAPMKVGHVGKTAWDRSHRFPWPHESRKNVTWILTVSCGPKRPRSVRQPIRIKTERVGSECSLDRMVHGTMTSSRTN